MVLMGNARPLPKIALWHRPLRRTKPLTLPFVLCLPVFRRSRVERKSELNGVEKFWTGVFTTREAQRYTTCLRIDSVLRGEGGSAFRFRPSYRLVRECITRIGVRQHTGASEARREVFRKKHALSALEPNTRYARYTQQRRR